MSWPPDPPSCHAVLACCRRPAARPQPKSAEGDRKYLLCLIRCFNQLHAVPGDAASALGRAGMFVAERQPVRWKAVRGGWPPAPGRSFGGGPQQHKNTQTTSDTHQIQHDSNVSHFPSLPVAFTTITSHLYACRKSKALLSANRNLCGVPTAPARPRVDERTATAGTGSNSRHHKAVMGLLS